MKRSIVIGLLALVEGSAAAKEPKGEDRALDEKTVLGEAITYKNLTVVPVLDKNKSKDAKDCLVLEVSYDQNAVRVIEREGGGSVNQLILENNSDKALFIMAGEVILGG